MSENKLQKLREAMLSEMKAFQVQVNHLDSAAIPDENEECILALDEDTGVLKSKLHVSKEGYVSNTEPQQTVDV